MIEKYYANYDDEECSVQLIGQGYDYDKYANDDNFGYKFVEWIWVIAVKCNCSKFFKIEYKADEGRFIDDTAICRNCFHFGQKPDYKIDYVKDKEEFKRFLAEGYELPKYYDLSILQKIGYVEKEGSE